MARKKSAAAPDVKLTPFEGHDVLSATIAIRNAGDGLSEALGVDPVELHQGETVMVALECEVDKIRFDPIRDTNGLQRVHVLKAGRATLIDSEVVAEALDAQTKRIEEAQGITRLDLDLAKAHNEGEHADGLVDGCAQCKAEVEAEARGD